MTATDHNLKSSYREALIEHLFVGELMKALWLQGKTMEVAKPQVDDSGYDLILDCGGVTRHVQLKASHRGSRTQHVLVNLKLSQKPSGCVVWVHFDDGTMELGPLYWFGSEPGKPLPDITGMKVATHQRRNAEGIKPERPNIRIVPKSKFEEVKSIPELLTKLFG
ncbi:MAG: hypothetical protein L6E13_00065 [Firmicutes bacterium]|nr:hypothetical protein [Bacillota bacterium]